MIKTFTVHGLHHKEVSPGKGSITWLVTDEKGTPRKVSGITDIDEEGVIEFIHPVYKRETPLVKHLYSAQKGDSFDLDFATFNLQEGYTARDAYDDMHTAEKASAISGNTRKYLLALGAVALLWFTYTAFNDVSLMEFNLTR